MVADNGAKRECHRYIIALRGFGGRLLRGFCAEVACMSKGAQRGSSGSLRCRRCSAT